MKDAGDERCDLDTLIREALGEEDADVDFSDLVKITKAVIRASGWWSTETDEGKKWWRKGAAQAERGTKPLCPSGDALLTQYAEALLEKVAGFQPDVDSDVSVIVGAVETLIKALGRGAVQGVRQG
ncbi:hypothetical protein WMF38_36500 [Sorangium sp. So ce118]